MRVSINNTSLRLLSNTSVSRRYIKNVLVLIIITYHILEQGRLKHACANAQARQSLRCSHTLSMDVDNGSEQKFDLQPHCMRLHGILLEVFVHMR